MKINKVRKKDYIFWFADSWSPWRQSYQATFDIYYARESDLFVGINSNHHDLRGFTIFCVIRDGIFHNVED